MTVMTTGCAQNLFGLKPAGQPNSFSAPVVTNWKPGDPVPPGYGMVTVTVRLPESLRKTLAFPSGEPGQYQALLYVHKGSSEFSAPVAVYDAFGNKAGYVAAIDTTTGLATFKLPPLPASTLNPTDAVTAANSYRFSIRVYNRTNGLLEPFAKIAPLTIFGHLNQGAGQDYETFDALTNTKLAMSGEVWSTVAPGLPIVVNVPKLYWHVGANLDSVGGTPIKSISLAGGAAQDGEYRVRVTNLDTSKLSVPGNVVVNFNNGDAAKKMNLQFKNPALFNQTVEIVGAASSVSIAANAKTALDGIGATFTDNYSTAAANGRLTITAKTSAANLLGTIYDRSKLLDTANISGGITFVQGASASFTLALGGTYGEYQPFSFGFEDAASVIYGPVLVSTGSADLSVVAAEIARKLNGNGGFSAAYTAGAASNVVTVASKLRTATRNYDFTDSVGKTTAAVGTVINSVTETAETAGNETTPPTFYNAVVAFSGTSSPKAGDTIIIKTKKSDNTNGPEFSYTAPADTTLNTFRANVETAINTQAQAVGFGFTADDTVADQLKLTAATVPGGKITSATIASAATALTVAVATTSTGVADIASASAAVTLDLEVKKAGGGTDALVDNDDINLAFSYTTLGGVAKSVSVTKSNITAANAATQVRDALNADADFKAAFDATATDPKTLTITASQSATFEGTNPAHNIAVVALRTDHANSFDSGYAKTLAPASSMSKAVRALFKFPTGTTFDSANPPTLSVTDANKSSSDIAGSIGKFVKTSAGGSANEASLTIISNTSELWRLLDVAANASGNDVPTSGRWNFTLKLNGASQIPSSFNLMDLDTAVGGSGTTVQGQ